MYVFFTAFNLIVKDKWLKVQLRKSEGYKKCYNLIITCTYMYKLALSVPDSQERYQQC